MDTGISTVEEAFAAAKIEMQNGAAALEVVGVPEQPTTEGAPSPEVDHPVPDPVTQELVDSLVEQPQADEVDPESAAFWQQTVEVNGEPTTLGELRNGGLRQSDYTKKTQELADQRRRLEAAEKFYEAFNENPEEFSKALGAQFGWWDSDASPVEDIRIPERYTQEQLEAELEQRLNERLASDPRIQRAQVLEAEALIDSEFAALEEKHQVKIPQALRFELLADAQRRNVYDLDLLFTHRLNESRGRQRTTEELARSATSRPNSRGGLGATSDPAAAVPVTVEEAWAQAKAEAGR